ncbi:BamA/TamA family outer membrane protein [Salinimicrobium sp. TH3]|uniref:BamA/TamA family outer membrane protein n=1 Tax=Salinimicrobium sp. TH3 TaxID=2997342 RepID=UPI002275CAEC|nr:BamA/TamA family outer membrane protein [Salinimicrobium sp. TH3]MCY2688567.1 BamA/TamA family outer membrane protein [Salinimicrobium sp. TH3]
MKKAKFLLLVFSLMSIICFGQEDTIRFKTTYTPLPNISYSPDTRLVLGALLLVQFKPGQAGPETRASNALLSTAFSFNEQSSVEADYTIIFPHERWFWKGYASYQKWPESFWGIGPETLEEDEVKVEYQKIIFRQKFLQQWKSNLFAGPYLQYTNMFNVAYFLNEDEEIKAPAVTGAEGGANLGLGASFIWDKRNSIMTPTTNHYLEFSTLFFSTNWFGDFNFQSYLLDARKYYDFTSGGKNVLAFHARIEHTAGEVPFRELAMLGGQEIMRGYMKGRYRDRTGAQVQTEFRRILTGRFGVVAFGALGVVGPGFDELQTEYIKWTAGGGLRYNINKANPTFIRLDYGVGKDTGGFYVTLGEAF